MRTKVVRYSRDHVHHYVYVEERREWVYVACELPAGWSHCTAQKGPLPRGQFDGSDTVDDEQVDAALLA